MASLWKAPEGKARPCRCQKGPHGPPNPGCSLPAPSLAHTLAGRGARLSWRRPRPGMCPQQQGRRRARLPDATAGTTRAPSPHSATPQPRPATGTLTEHGHELLGVEVPVAPVGPVAVQRGVLLVVVRRFRPEGVDDPDPAPAPGDGEPQTLPGPGVPQPWVVPCEESLGSDRAVRPRAGTLTSLAASPSVKCGLQQPSALRAVKPLTQMVTCYSCPYGA